MIQIPKKFLSRYSHRARKILLETLSRPGKPEALDLLEILINHQGALGSQLLSAYGITPLAVSRMRESVNLEPQKTDDEPEHIDKLSGELKILLKRATTLASQHHSIYIGTEHLVAALLEDKKINKLLIQESSKRAVKELEEHLTLLLVHTAELNHLMPLANEQDAAQDLQKTTKRGQKTAQKEERHSLDVFTEDLLERAKEKKLDPLVGRDAEVERVITILSRRTKNNPLLIGEAGVGKTAIVEGLAQRMYAGTVPSHLSRKRLLSLDLGLLIAGTVFRGEFEARLKDVIQDAEDEEAILFIDEMHTLVGAGSAQGSLDAANMLKPAISSHKLQIIGATTLDEYRTHLEKDPALERRLQPIVVKEPTPEETLKILNGIRERFEEHHKVILPDNVLTHAVDLADRYLSQRFFPDKAIDIIDEAAAHLRSSQARTVSHEQKDEIEDALEALQDKKERAVEDEHYGEALILKREEENLLKSLRELDQEPLIENRLSVSTADIEFVVSKMSGVPIEEITASEKDKLMNLETHLMKDIIGQDHAISHVSSALRRARSGVSSGERPMGSFLFIGPSGVGKTELARTLAGTFFGRQDSFIKLDMSEFSEPHTVAKLLGAPAGYVGYDDNGTFAEKIRRNPHSLVLFDEIEKAHPVAHNLLLQILENGEITDNKGMRVSFKNTLVVLTSNIGTQYFVEDATRPGFDRMSSDRGEALAQNELKETFKPELISRLDEVIFFKTLTKEDVRKIVLRELEKLAIRMQKKQILLSFRPSVVNYLTERSISKDHGARKVRTEIQSFVETGLAEKIIQGEIDSGKRVHLGEKKGELTYV